MGARGWVRARERGEEGRWWPGVLGVYIGGPGEHRGGVTIDD
jgi:hypothetical protein